MTKIDLSTIDLILLSHAHPDHFDGAKLDRGAPILLPPADLKTIQSKGFRRPDALAWGQSRRIDAGIGTVTITAIPAHHSRDAGVAKMMGTGNGYWIELQDGTSRRKLYWTGDTFPTSDVVTAVKAYGTPDLLIPNLGGVGRRGQFGQISMGAADVIELSAALHPRHVLPIHHSTYAFYSEPIDKLIRLSKGRPYRLDVIGPGKTMLY